MSRPRNILLMEEFENAMKGNYGSVSFGVLNGDITLTNWQGSIVTQKGDIFEFDFVCDQNYPENCPTIIFNKKQLSNKNLSKMCNSEGKINDDILNKMKWDKNTTIGNYLLQIKKLLDN